MTKSTLNIGGTRAYQSVLLRRIFLGWPALIAVFVVLSLLGMVGFQSGNIRPIALGLFIAGFGYHVVKTFFRERLENDEASIPADAHIAEYLSAEVLRGMHGKRVISGSDVLRAASTTKRGLFMLDEMGISSIELQSSCAQVIDDEMDVDQFLHFALKNLETLKETRIDANVILYLLFSHVDCCKELQHKADLSDEDLLGLMQWEYFHHKFKVSEKAWSPEAIKRNASIGRSWVMGYTDALDQLTSEVNTAAHGTGEKSIVIHRAVIDNVMRVLARSKQRNVLLMGKIGVGKKTLIENIAITLRAQERAGNTPFTRILELHTEQLLSGTADPDAFLLKALSRAQSSGHFVLVVRDLALLLRSASGNLKAVIMKCLETQNMSVIGIVDIQDYHSLIKTEPMLDSTFEKVPVDDASDEETMTVLMAHYFAAERSVRITYKAFKSIMDLSKRYLGSFGGFPGKALDVMDDAMLRAVEFGHGFVNEEHVRDVISLKSRVNVQRVNTDEKVRLLELEDKLKNKIIGQDAAVKAVSGALKRARMDLSDRKRPVGTFLFLGPTGVGKTQTAKTLAEEYFGSSDAMIRLDMNEYSHSDSVLGITGGSASGEGFLAKLVQDKPFSLILLDEIEKAHSSVLNLFLQILDEGFLNDARGMRTDFRNTIIIATSNAGALFIRDFVREHQQFDKNQFKAALIETILKEKLFTPEFINRFDEVVLYYPLSQDGAAQVASLMLGDIISDIQKRRGITVKVEEDVVGGLVERGYSVEFGAREMRRTITEMIEDYLADYLLKRDVKRGEEILIKKGDLQW